MLIDRGIQSAGEIDESSVIRKFRITAADGKGYNSNHYNLSAIITVGNNVDSAVRCSSENGQTAKIAEQHALSEFEKQRWLRLRDGDGACGCHSHLMT